MLVLSRKVGEKLMVGDDIVVIVNRISGNRVTVGIEAPKTVKVLRAEVVEHQAQQGGSDAQQPAA